MKTSPWAKLMRRTIPYTIVYPSAIRAYTNPSCRPFSACWRKYSTVSPPSPHFSPGFYCGGGYWHAYCVALGRAPRRSLNYASGALGRAPCIHTRLHHLATNPGEKCGLLRDDLVQRVFDNPGGPFLLEDGDQIPDDLLVDDDLEGEPAGLAQGGDRRVLHRRQHLEDPVEVAATDVHLETDRLLRAESALEEQGDVPDLFPFPRILPCLPVRDEDGGRLEDRLHDTEVVRPKAAPRLGQLDDRVGEARRLHLGGPPGELDLGLDPLLLQVAPGELDQFGRHPLSLQVPDPVNGGIVRDRHHPSDRPQPSPGVEEGTDLLHLRVLLQHPGPSGQTHVEDAVLDVSRPLLGADQQPGELRVVDRGDVAAGADVDIEAGLAEQVQCRLLQAPLRQADVQDVALLLFHGAPLRLETVKPGIIHTGGTPDKLVQRLANTLAFDRRCIRSSG